MTAKFVGYLNDSYRPVTTEVEHCLFCDENTSQCIKH